MKKLMLAAAVLISGLLFSCPEVRACEDDIFPTAGFQEFVDEIEPSECIMPEYYVTDEEAVLLLAVGVLEGGEKDVDGIAHVMQVILNRVASPEFPNTIAGVIFQKDPIQFCTASRLATANITPEAYVALDAVIFGEYGYNQCLYFESLSGLAFASWADYQFSYGGHDFYI